MTKHTLRNSGIHLAFCYVLYGLLIGSWQSHAWAGPRVLAVDIEQLLPPHVGAAVMAVDDGKLIFKHAWGKRRSDRSEHCTTSTNFRLASVSKQFTATSVMVLVDRDVIHLDATLDQFFPDCPSYWHEITVHQLLTHTSGIPAYEELIPKGTTLQLTDQNVLAVLLDTSEPVFKPGTKFEYSNSGYTLLGLIVETAAHQPFHQFMKSEVLNPAGMKRSVLFTRGLNSVTERAYGHESSENEKWIVADQSLTSAVRGDGGVYSSLDDLESWLRAVDEGRLLSEPSREAMFTPHVKTDRGDESYGYGWFIGTYRGERRIWHAGSTRGFSTMMQTFPDRHAATVILLNRSAPESAGDYVENIVDRLLFADQNER